MQAIVAQESMHELLFVPAPAIEPHQKFKNIYMWLLAQSNTKYKKTSQFLGQFLRKLNSLCEFIFQIHCVVVLLLSENQLHLIEVENVLMDAQSKYRITKRT